MTQPQYIVAPVRETSSLAVIALIASIASWLCFPVFGALVGVILGHIALRDVRDNNLNGKTQVIWALALGYPQVIAFLVFLAFLIGGAITG